MKKTRKYNNNFSEYEKAIQFLEKGCRCGCSKKVPSEEFAQLRTQFQTLSKKEQDAFLMAQLINTKERETTTSSRFPKRKRTNYRVSYRWNNVTSLCQETYFNMLGISLKYFESVKDHLLSKGLLKRTHGNVDRKPQWVTKMTIDQNVRKEVKKFIENYAKEHGSPDPSQKYAKGIAIELWANGGVTFLPVDMSYKSVHHDFVMSVGEDNKLKSLKYEAFRRLWHELAPNIKFRNPRTDLCDTCHQFRNEIHSCKDEVTRSITKKNLSNIRKEQN
jgi:hypothetical protein